MELPAMKRHLLSILAHAGGGLAWGIGFALGVVAVAYAAYEMLVANDVLKM
jgi:hypothetical protein